MSKTRSKKSAATEGFAYSYDFSYSIIIKSTFKKGHIKAITSDSYERLEKYITAINSKKKTFAWSKGNIYALTILKIQYLN